MKFKSYIKQSFHRFCKNFVNIHSFLFDLEACSFDKCVVTLVFV